MLLLSGCNKAHVETVNAYAGGALPPPDRVLVEDFRIDPGDVRVDQGIRARLMRAAGNQPSGAEQQIAAQKAQTALTETLVALLRSYGAPAEAASASGSPGAGRAVLVQGQILSIDEGNRTRRTMIGLGAGASSVSASAEILYQQPNEPPRLLETFDANGDSGHAPGMAETMGAGAAADRLAASAAAGAGLHSVSERRSAGDDDNARRIAEGLAAQLRQFFVSQGWLPAGK